MRGMVRYCPGAAPGVPNVLSRQEVQEHINLDVRYVHMMIDMEAMPRGSALPHVGSCPKNCRHYEETTGSPRQPSWAVLLGVSCILFTVWTLLVEAMK